MLLDEISGGCLSPCCPFSTPSTVLGEVVGSPLPLLMWL